MATSTSLLMGTIHPNQPNKKQLQIQSLSPYNSFNPPKPNTIATILLSSQHQARLQVLVYAAAPANEPLDLTEENIQKVLEDARAELAQLFDSSVGITGRAQLAELDGPYVKIRLTGKFWHKRSTVLARLDNYLRQRIPEILEVDVEDEKQLDDSPSNF